MSSFEVTGLPVDEVNALVAGLHPDPFRILGPHRVGNELAIRVFRPDAKEVTVVVQWQSAEACPGGAVES